MHKWNNSCGYNEKREISFNSEWHEIILVRKIQNLAGPLLQNSLTPWARKVVLCDPSCFTDGKIFACLQKKWTGNQPRKGDICSPVAWEVWKLYVLKYEKYILLMVSLFSLRAGSVVGFRLTAPFSLLRHRQPLMGKIFSSIGHSNMIYFVYHMW